MPSGLSASLFTLPLWRERHGQPFTQDLNKLARAFQVSFSELMQVE
jgi:hypothetical protein